MRTSKETERFKIRKVLWKVIDREGPVNVLKKFNCMNKVIDNLNNEASGISLLQDPIFQISATANNGIRLRVAVAERIEKIVNRKGLDFVLKTMKN